MNPFSFNEESYRDPNITLRGLRALYSHQSEVSGMSDYGRRNVNYPSRSPNPAGREDPLQAQTNMRRIPKTMQASGDFVVWV